VQIHDVEIVGGVPDRLQVLYSAPQRRPDLRRRRLVVDHCQKRSRSPSGRGRGGRNGPSSIPSIAAARSRWLRNAPMSVLSIWWSIDSPASRGSRPTQMYVTVGSLGIPSSGIDMNFAQSADPGEQLG
jgi:hypothetical protein